jgi:hypothetical protein
MVQDSTINKALSKVKTSPKTFDEFAGKDDRSENRLDLHYDSLFVLDNLKYCDSFSYK